MDIYLELKNYLPHDHGHYRSGLCPFHDDHTPSLLAYQDGFFICEACGEQGNSLRLLTKFKGGRIGHSRKYGQPDVHLPTWDQQDELGELMAEAHRVLLNFPGMRWYLRQRGVESRWQPCRLGWHEGWITLPVTTQSGKIGLMLRATPGIHSQQRFTSPAGQPALLYCPDLEKLAQAKQAFIVFGMFDALTFAELGLPVVTTTGGKDSFDPAWLNGYRIPFWIIRDDKEEAIQAKLLAGLDWRGRPLHLTYPLGAKDPNDFLRLGKQRDLLAQLPPDATSRIGLCGERTPASKRCGPDCVCTKPLGHFSDHMAQCGVKWKVRVRK